MVSKSKSKSKIIAVPIDNTSLSFDDNEPTEAQEMDKVLDEIKTESCWFSVGGMTALELKNNIKI